MAHATVADILGGSKVVRRSVKHETDLLRLSRSGVSMKALRHLAKSLSLSLKEIAALLHVSERNLQRYSATQRLSAAVSGRVVQLASVTARGIEVFGDRERFRVWLTEPSLALDGASPLDVLDTPIGTQLVLDELGRLEHGVLA